MKLINFHQVHLLILARVPGIGGKKPTLLDPQGFVMMYIKTDGEKKFFKWQAAQP